MGNAGVSLTGEERERVVRFLLDDLDQEDQESLESRFLGEDEYYREVAVIEEGLIRDYLLGRLEPERRAMFRKKYSSTGALEARVEETRQVMLALGSLTTRRSWLARASAWLSPGLSAPSLVFVAAGILLVSVLSVRIVPLRSGSAVVAPASFVLARGQRGASAGIPLRLDVPRNARIELHAELALHRDATSYRAVVSTPEGAQVWGVVLPGSKRSVDGRSLTVSIPAGVLRGGDYIFTLQAPGAAGYESFDEYAFGITGSGR